ncbi:MAG: tryptophan 7-halogenase [Pseudomonadota bacterium]
MPDRPEWPPHSLPAAMSDVDVAIVGAGPAGCAAATTIAAFSHHRVTVIERSAPVQKPGEMLQPGADALLEYLGIGPSALATIHKPSHSLASAWGSDQRVERPLIGSMGPPAMHVDRIGFEAMLRRRAASCGASFHHGHLARAERQRDHWRLSVRSDEQPIQINARFIIDASGRGARLACQAGASIHTTHRTVAAWRTGSLRSDRDAQLNGSVLVEAVPEGWWYSAAQPGNVIAAALFTDADEMRQARLNRAPGWREALARTTHTKTRLADLESWGPLQIRPAHVQFIAPAHGRDWIACGDAAIAVDPLSSMGISLALLTGIHAGRIAAAACSGQDVGDCGYSREIRRQHLTHIDTLKRFFEAETRWPDAPFWKRRHSKPNASVEDAPRDVLV